MNTKLKTAYRIVEVPYVRFTGRNVDEVKSFVGEASSTMPRGGGYWFDNVGELWFLFSNAAQRGDAVKPGCCLVWIDDEVRVLDRETFRKTYRIKVRKPLFKRGERKG